MKRNKLIEDLVKTFGLIAISSVFFLSAMYLEKIPTIAPYADFLFYGMGIMCMFTVGIIIERIWDTIN